MRHSDHRTMPDSSSSAPLRYEQHYGDRVVECYTDRPPNVYGILSDATARYPDNTALICGGTRLSYAELDTNVRQVAAGLAARGVGRGDRVAMLLGNGVPFVVVTYAVAFLGAVTVPLNTRDQMPGIRHALLNSDAMALIIDAKFRDIVPLPADTPTLTAQFSVGEALGFEAYETLLQDAPAAHPTQTADDAIATILYTSGTTGSPRNRTLRHKFYANHGTGANGQHRHCGANEPCNRIGRGDTHLDPLRGLHSCDANIQGCKIS
jgi:long-chain acyl-CoA synthetase